MLSYKIQSQRRRLPTKRELKKKRKWRKRKTLLMEESLFLPSLKLKRNRKLLLILPQEILKRRQRQRLRRERNQSQKPEPLLSWSTLTNKKR